MKKKWRDYIGRFLVRMILLSISLLVAVFFKNPYTRGFIWGVAFVVICEGIIEIAVANHNIKLISEDK